MRVFQKVLLVKTTSCYRKLTEGGKHYEHYEHEHYEHYEHEHYEHYEHYEHEHYEHYEHSEIERSVAYL